MVLLHSITSGDILHPIPPIHYSRSVFGCKNNQSTPFEIKLAMKKINAKMYIGVEGKLNSHMQYS